MQVSGDCATTGVSPCGRFSHIFTPCSSPTSATPLYGFFVRPRAWVHHGVDVFGTGRDATEEYQIVAPKTFGKMYGSSKGIPVAPSHGLIFLP